MQLIDDRTLKRITEFMSNLQEWFENWFNATTDKASLQEYEKRMHSNWRLINKETPKVINDKETFLMVWPSFYGRYKDQPIKQKCDI
ncbi:MAG: hypothetical protein HeimC2_39910 [Candidatus Heimdallarchaeota archaeon LC_2]|nr:MAG: hypothetical protein HeimC2_39910 [Candidatus Heimdallarchaeota archaeon LC_2]